MAAAVTTGAKASRDDLIRAAHLVLKQNHPMTVRQTFYRLVANHTIANTQLEYKRVVRALTQARLDGVIPWDWVEDRIRKPISAVKFATPDQYLYATHSWGWYKRDRLADQPWNIECWVEKDALSGMFHDVIWREPYITLNVGRGYDGWSSIKEAARRYRELDKPTVIYYFGDFDPSGQDIPRSLEERLGQLGAFPDLRIVALTEDDIEQYELPPDPTKTTDSRAAEFKAKYGDRCVELDALPPSVLRQRIRDVVWERIDRDVLAKTREREEEDREWLKEQLQDLEVEAENFEAAREDADETDDDD